MCILSAAEALRAGLLKEAGHGQFGDPFARIADGQGWGDFVDNYFSCAACSQPFRLHAETYHGSGGSFERCSQRDIAA